MQPPTYYLHDGGEPIIELSSTGTVDAINVRAPDGLVARKESGTWTYYTFDQQGSVVQKLNSSGSVTATRTYDAYGAETGTGNSGTDPFGYNAQWGYYLDRATGMYLCQHRWYDPSQGRWLNRDPIGYPGGVNLYGCCRENPMSRVDPRGLALASVFTWIQEDTPPAAPPGVNADRNVTRIWQMQSVLLEDAASQYNPAVPGSVIASACDYSLAKITWYRNLVQDNGPWDFKKRTKDGRYEPYGNWHYGVTGSALGLSEYALLNAAGQNQIQNANKSSGHPSKGILLFKYPYGDDPADTEMIRKGIRYYDRHFRKLEPEFVSAIEK